MAGDGLWLYFVLLVGIVVVPGMDMLFVLANALTGGRGAGLAATFGVMAGGACHVLFGTAFVSALSAFIPSVSLAMMVAGSLYMMWIGFSLARSSIAVEAVPGAPLRAERTVFLQGMATCLLNPKAWLFILAVFPQFMRPANGPLWQQAVIMGVMTVGVQMTVYGTLALAAARSRDALTGNPSLTMWIGRGAGMLLIGLAGLTLAEALRGG